MRQKVELPPELLADIDQLRGGLSRSKYIDNLLKKAQGVTRAHTPDRDCPKRKPKK